MRIDDQPEFIQEAVRLVENGEGGEDVFNPDTQSSWIAAELIDHYGLHDEVDWSAEEANAVAELHDWLRDPDRELVAGLDYEAARCTCTDYHVADCPLVTG